jgi:DNA modification methylase
MNTPRVPSFDPPNPASVQEADEEKGKYVYGFGSQFTGTQGYGAFDPPNPASVQEEQEDLFGEKPTERRNRRKEKGSGGAYEHDPPNPASVQEDNSIDIFDEIEEPHLAPFSVYEGTKCFIGKRNHQTEKPQDILEFILKYWTDEGDVVLDPTMGSGSTGVACKKMGRSFIGIELTDKYYEVANQRINPELGKGCE